MLMSKIKYLVMALAFIAFHYATYAKCHAMIRG